MSMEADLSQAELLDDYIWDLDCSLWEKQRGELNPTWFLIYSYGNNKCHCFKPLSFGVTCYTIMYNSKTHFYFLPNILTPMAWFQLLLWQPAFHRCELTAAYLSCSLFLILCPEHSDTTGIRLLWEVVQHYIWANLCRGGKNNFLLPF